MSACLQIFGNFAVVNVDYLVLLIVSDRLRNCESEANIEVCQIWVYGFISCCQVVLSVSHNYHDNQSGLVIPRVFGL